MGGGLQERCPLDRKGCIMEKRNIKGKRNIRCEYCTHLIAIGGGDHICYECGEEPVMPVSGYTFTEDYLKCGGSRYDEN